MLNVVERAAVESEAAGDDAVRLDGFIDRNHVHLPLDDQNLSDHWITPLTAAKMSSAISSIPRGASSIAQSIVVQLY